MIPHSYLGSAVTILQSYNGSQPFHLYIKKYFAANKKFGSRDRKQITSLCYNYFRLGNAAKDISVEDKILLAEQISNKQYAIDHTQLIENIFPFRDELSESIDPEKFNLSFLIQPDLFLRVRPGNSKRVTGKLSGAGIFYKLMSEYCIALPNASRVDTVIELDKEAVVQDLNSQRTGELMEAVRSARSDRGRSGRVPSERTAPPRVWDCCAASGGKSIMAYDINPQIELTVSDKRGSILQNLYKRFAGAGIKEYQAFVADLANGQVADSAPPGFGGFDLIICDAPCTGSGTWSRTPEQLLYFKKQSIKQYAQLQKKIVKNVVPHLRPGGQLLYITCSVFKKENEDVVEYIKQDLRLTLQRMELLKGYQIKADTLFAALFTAPPA
jgi:16S rRNA (cytosine967-C5)-methyltransferase